MTGFELYSKVPKILGFKRCKINIGRFYLNLLIKNIPSEIKKKAAIIHPNLTPDVTFIFSDISVSCNFAVNGQIVK
jgi:hypothetical protein